MMKRNIALVALTLALASVLAPAHAEDIVPIVTLDQPVVAAGSNGTVHLLIRFVVPVRGDEDSASRPPVHLALVMDRSGSMGDAGKMTYAKAAAKSLIGLLRPEDRLAVVDYDNVVTALWPSAPLVAPELAMRAIDSLEPRGATNLAAGLVAGLGEIHRDRQPGYNCRTILLSDGLANTGETRPAVIAAMAAHGRQQGIGVTTMGLGLDYNEDLMQGIAAAGGGRYYYVENPAAMSRIFQEEMGKVLHQATREFTLWFDHGPASAGITVYGYPTAAAAGRTTITMHDLYGGDAVSVLVGVQLASPDLGAQELGRIGVSYVDAADGRTRRSEHPVLVTGSADAQLVAASVDVPTAVEARLIVADDRHDRAVRTFEAGDKAGAVALLDTLREEISAAETAYGDPKLTKKLEALALEQADMSRAEQEPAYRADYLKRSKEAFYGSRQGKRGKYLLVEGSAGLAVENLQRVLADRGYYAGALDGSFDDEVRAAVAAYQAANGLTADGLAGPATLRSLGLY
ncbi:MAG: VWA domain-containing protein [Krumholzibacteria bacterium]|nr:VWA domain-containing protein [Candidatus Krumholzibacteria bacterium]